MSLVRFRSQGGILGWCQPPGGEAEESCSCQHILPQVVWMSHISRVEEGDKLQLKMSLRLDLGLHSTYPFENHFNFALCCIMHERVCTASAPMGHWQLPIACPPFGLVHHVAASGAKGPMMVTTSYNTVPCTYVQFIVGSELPVQFNHHSASRQLPESRTLTY